MDAHFALRRILVNSVLAILELGSVIKPHVAEGRCRIHARGFMPDIERITHVDYCRYNQQYSQRPRRNASNHVRFERGTPKPKLLVMMLQCLLQGGAGDTDEVFQRFILSMASGDPDCPLVCRLTVQIKQAHESFGIRDISGDCEAAQKSCGAI